MSARPSEQDLLIQLETALHRLVESFWEEPYRYFTESDAVTALQTWVATRPAPAQICHTADDFATGLLHREYPTFFRFKKRHPSERLPRGARRGHYDLVLIDPAYIQLHRAETVINRSIRNRGDLSTPPLLAAVEFKLLTQGWTRSRLVRATEDLGKLRLAMQPPADAGATYLCVLQRDMDSRPDRRRPQWLDVEERLQGYPKICTVVAICWPKQDREPFVHYGGPWITNAA